jgi:hypothetical protein
MQGSHSDLSGIEETGAVVMPGRYSRNSPDAAHDPA